jgi:hypothetical protein
VDSVRAPIKLSSAFLGELTPVVDEAGRTLYCSRPMYEFFRRQGGKHSFTFEFPELPQVPVNGEDTRQWSKPATLEFWADVFERSERGMRNWIQKGTVCGKKPPGGQRWSILWTDLPRSWREKHPEMRE